MRVLTAFLLFSFAITVQAETTPVYSRPKIPLMSLITEIPDTAINTLKYSFTRDSIPAWMLITSTTLGLYHLDDEIYRDGRHLGQIWGIGSDDHTKTVVSGFGFDLLRLPSDTGSALYFLGDGWIHFGAAVTFWANGAITGNSRPYNTGIQIFHGMVVSTLFSQSIKRITGRESPNKATAPRGRWRPFPSVKTYQERTAEYDAFPSGHIMTATLAFTVINENYPEYRAYVVPLEVLWLAALGFEMVNNGVHWASDYPLGIAIGYAVGKMATRMGHQGTATSDSGSGTKRTNDWVFFPSVGEDAPMINAMMRW